MRVLVCHDDRESQTMVELLSSALDPDVDTVRLYRLCGRCAPLTILLGQSPEVQETETDWFF